MKDVNGKPVHDHHSVFINDACYDISCIMQELKENSHEVLEISEEYFEKNQKLLIYLDGKLR